MFLYRDLRVGLSVTQCSPGVCAAGAGVVSLVKGSVASLSGALVAFSGSAMVELVGIGERVVRLPWQWEVQE